VTYFVAVNGPDGQTLKYQRTRTCPANSWLPRFGSSALLISSHRASMDVLEHPIKVVCVGSGGVGKTSLLTTIVRRKFPVPFQPWLLNPQKVSIQINPSYHGSGSGCGRASDWRRRFKGNTRAQEPRETVALMLWDTMGQEDFDRLRPYSYHGASVVVVCFSVVDREAFEQIRIRVRPIIHG
jgi:small GTP-binding protein